MKVWHFLHVSSQIIGKQRYRSNATAIASSTDLQIGVTSTTNQANAPSCLLGYAGARTNRVILPDQLRQPITEQAHAQFNHPAHLVRGGMHQPVED